jgi:glyoxylase I family protein
MAAPAMTAPVIGLSHVQLVVSDVEASAVWYGTVLGLVPYAQNLDVGYVALRQPEAKFVVVLSRDPHPGPRSAGSACDLDHLAFAISDADALRAWAKHLAEAGIVHDGVVSENGHPTLQLRDPDGISVELVAP